jgi:ABC-type nitrate/sulfonate/bicarbonate transport system permease component
VAVREEARAPADTRSLAGRAFSASRWAAVLMRYASGLTLALFLLAWEAAVRILNTPEFLLPPPSAIFREVIVSWEILLPHMVQTLKEIAMGYGVSAVVAILLGVGIAMSGLLEKALMPLLIATDAIPKIAIAPLLLIWFGTGALSKVILVGLVTFFPILITTITGMQSADPNLVRMFRSVGASRRHEIFKLRLPYAVPYVFAGLKVATTLSVIGAVIAEWVSSSSGLGYLIISGITNFQTLLVFAGIFVLILISLSFYSAVSLLGRKLSWRDSTETNIAAGV